MAKLARSTGPLWTVSAEGQHAQLVTAPTAREAAERYLGGLKGYTGFINVREGSTGRLQMFRSTKQRKARK